MRLPHRQVPSFRGSTTRIGDHGGAPRLIHDSTINRKLVSPTTNLTMANIFIGRKAACYSLLEAEARIFYVI